MLSLASDDDGEGTSGHCRMDQVVGTLRRQAFAVEAYWGDVAMVEGLLLLRVVVPLEDRSHRRLVGRHSRVEGRREVNNEHLPCRVDMVVLHNHTRGGQVQHYYRAPHGTPVHRLR